jgi:hypothetical protein
MLLYKVVENSQATTDTWHDMWEDCGVDSRDLKLCSSLEVAERFLKSLEGNKFIKINNFNQYYDPAEPENGPKYFPCTYVWKYAIEAIEIE